MDTLVFPTVTYQKERYPTLGRFFSSSGDCYYLIFTGKEGDRTSYFGRTNPLDNSQILFKGNYESFLTSFLIHHGTHIVHKHLWVNVKVLSDLSYEFPDNENASVMLQDFDQF